MADIRAQAQAILDERAKFDLRFDAVTGVIAAAFPPIGMMIAGGRAMRAFIDDGEYEKQLREVVRGKRHTLPDPPVSDPNCSGIGCM